MSKAQWIKENLKDGEYYAGILLGENGEPDQHIILLPGQVVGQTWENCKAWAVLQGGELPTRREQRILFANAKGQFDSEWYWSCEQHASNPSYAWSQNFVNGDQDILRKTCEGRARAVRRLPI
jgi:hypothetical protein